MEVKNFYVYELWNPLKNEVFYVGKGTKHDNGYYRLSNHIKDSRYAKSGKIGMTHKFRTILKILDSGNKPEMKIVFESTDHDAIIQKEIDLISQYGRRDIGTGILCNHTNGGEGSLGNKHTEEYIHNMKTNNKGGQITSKPIYAICPSTFSIIEYASGSEAAKILNGLKTNINTCANRFKNRVAYGYYWRFINDYDPNEDFAKLNELRDNSFASSKIVNQYSLDGTLIKEWKSASDICRYYNRHVSTLHRHLKNNTPWNDYIWKFRSDHL